LYYAGQKATALEVLHALQQHSFLNQYYLLNATLGKIYLLEGNPTKSRHYFQKALQQTDFQLEREWIQKMIGRLEECNPRE
jgi:predicted negative regulator of RcsB-dependent stress response